MGVEVGVDDANRTKVTGVYFWASRAETDLDWSQTHLGYSIIPRDYSYAFSQKN